MADKKKGALTPGDYTKNIGNRDRKVMVAVPVRKRELVKNKLNGPYEISSVEAQFDKAFKNPSNGARRNKK